MKDISLRRSLSDRKLAKKDKARTLDRSLTPISIIGEKNSEEHQNMADDSMEYSTADNRLKKNKFWKLKVSFNMGFHFTKVVTENSHIL